jgi:hypothetical protein
LRVTLAFLALARAAIASTPFEKEAHVATTASRVAMTRKWRDPLLAYQAAHEARGM